ncbi:MAG: bifunctional pyr operon transcriptional regulator/uracil phosphoribosyltransferase PyrR [Gammaproteobacteria bacterium]|jgi:pyrimidine operon attenuation protein / uracil phosphoribosyltransferase
MVEQVTQTAFMQENAILDLIDGMASQLKRQLQQNGISEAAMIGIHTGGVWIAEKLHEKLQLAEPLGTLNISFYRDDFSRIGINPKVHPSNIPFEVEDKHIILVDDVLQTGRTIRAAMNEIFDFGRPASIIYATLIEKDGRELPIQASVVGLKPMLKQNDYLTLKGPSPLSLVIGRKLSGGDSEA